MRQSDKPLRPGSTPDAREQQVVALAMDEAERRIREGTASSQLICHFLKLASSRERLEQERLELENELTKAKTEAVASAKRVEELYAEAIVAMKTYSGSSND